MVKIKSVKFNFIMNAILTASTFIFPLITFPYISRVLLPEGVGKVNFATSLASYFVMIAMLGIPTYGIRACARVRDDREELSRTVQEILIINAVMGVIAVAFFAGAVMLVPRLRDDPMLYYIAGTLIILNVIGVEWMYKGLEQYSYITVRSIIFKIIGVILMFLFVKGEGDYVIYCAVSIIASAGSYVLNFFNLRRYIDIKPTGGYNFRRHLKPIGVFFLMSVATTIYTNLDTVMLGFMKDDTQVGYYTAAVRVKTILVSFVTSLSTVLMPRVSYYIEQGMRKEFLRVSRKALNFVVLAAMSLSLYFFMYAPETIGVLSGAAFSDSVLPMRIIMPTIVFIGITNVLGIQIMVPMGQERNVCISVAAGAVTDLILNMICIPYLGCAGAAYGTLAAEIVVLVIQCVMLKGQLGDLFDDIQIYKILPALAVGGALAWLIKLCALPDFAALVLSALVFFAVYGGILLLARERFVWDTYSDVMRRIRKRSA